MPSLLTCWRKLPDGTIEKGPTVAFDDSGSGSILSAQEEQRLKALGYETRILRATQEPTRDK
jgi:hypothetical protein